MTKEEFTNYLKACSSIELSIRHKIEQIHNDVNQKYDEHPYFYHLDKVARNVVEYLPYICERFEDIVPVLFGAYFHDSIEDARLTYNDVAKIAKEYMPEGQALMATEIVYACTNEKGKNRNGNQ